MKILSGFILLLISLSAPAQKSTADLLQGKWQSIEDSSNYLVFDRTKKMEIAKGLSHWEVEAYRLTHQCANAKPSKDFFIYCPESEMCYRIITLNANKLSLFYVDGAQTLNYQRVKIKSPRKH